MAIDGAPSARLPETAAGVESEAGGVTSDRAYLWPCAEASKIRPEHHPRQTTVLGISKKTTWRDLARTTLSPASRSRLFAEIQESHVGDANLRTEIRLDL